jgi:ABC-type multidrug transport system, permease component
MNISRTLSIARKEMAHILRDPFTLAMVIAMPIVMVLFFGYAIEFNLRKIPLGVFDPDKSESARELESIFTSSGYFVAKSFSSPRNLLQGIEEGKVKTALLFNKGFEKELGNFGSNVQVLLDGTDNSSAASVLGYLGGLQRRAQVHFYPDLPRPPLDLQTRFLFNPELRSRWFVVPGLAAVIIALLSILLTALTVAREWENGSMELLLSTPVTPIEIIVGKLAPYAVMGLFAVFFVFALAIFVFQVPFQGSLFLYLIASLIFILTYLCQGLLISVVTRKQQLAMQMAMLSGLLPTILLSGFIFPIEHMPKFFKILTMAIPARWYIEISRRIYLRGAGITNMWFEYLMLLILFGILLTISVKKFKKDVEP